MSCPSASIHDFRYLKNNTKSTTTNTTTPTINNNNDSHDTDGGKGRKTSDIKTVFPKEMRPGILDFNVYSHFF